MSKLSICRPINELNLKSETITSKYSYKTTYNQTFSTEIPKSSSYSTHMKTTKEFNDNRNTNTGLRVYKDQSNILSLSCIDSKENNYYKIKRVLLPNSKRMINPILRPKENTTHSKNFLSRSHHPAPGNFNTLLDKTDDEKSITKCRKTPNSKVFKSINIMRLETEPQQPFRRELCKGEFIKFSDTTQIEALPGAIKRDQYSIKDDKKFQNKFNQGHFLKMIRDFNSNVQCLSNTHTANYPTLQRFGKFYDRLNKVNMARELISTSDGNIEYNYFKSEMIDNKNRHDAKEKLGITFGVSSNKKTPIAFRKEKPKNILNMFKSQIQFG